MSRILYGVSGEGSGHSSRAMEIGRHLLAEGHQLKMVTYDRGLKALAGEFDCFAIEGLHIVSDDNRVRPLKTVWNNLRRAPRAVRRLVALRRMIREFQPDVVLTDFEPTSAWLAWFFDLPLISLDNQHRMRYMSYESPPGLSWSRRITETIIKLMIPAPDAALATTYFFGEPRNDRTFLFPPILRREVLECRPYQGGHHLVYVTSEFTSLLGLLRQFPEHRFIVYGSSQQGEDANLTFRPFSVDGFLRDLESCQSVIATAGFTLISEALYLGKPYLALPMQGQFEQQLNAFCLEQLGYGMSAAPAGVRQLARFFDNLPALSESAQRYADSQQITDVAQANLGIRTKLDELLGQRLQQLHR